MRLLLLPFLLVAAGALNAQPIRDLRIGAVDGPEPYQFFRIGAIDVSAAGEIFVLDGGANRIRVFGPDGQHRRTFGSQGPGPGEFRNAYGLVVTPNRVIVQDGDGFEFFAHDGSHQSALATATLGRLAVLYTTAEIDLIVRTSAQHCRAAPPGQLCRDTLAFHRLDPASSTLGPPFLRVPGSARARLAAPGNGPAITPLFADPFSIQPDGTGNLYVVPGRDYRIDVFAPTGQRVRTITRQHRPRAVTDRDLVRLRSCIDDRLARGGRGPAGGAFVERLALGRPEVFPAVARILVADHGAIWVQRADIGDLPIERACGISSPAIWDRFDHTGRFLGTVSLPASFTAHHVSDSAVLGTERDDLDVEYVVRYRVAG
jgi:hypothetical protein